jgi:hypothetical protein
VAIDGPQQRAVRQSPQAHLPGGRARGKQAAIRAEGDRAPEIEPFRQHRLGQTGINKTRVLRFDLSQIGLPERQSRQVQPTQVASQKPQQIDNIPGSIALLRLRSLTPSRQHRMELLRRSEFIVPRV